MTNIFFLFLGFGLGFLGTLIGAGGGFVLVPVLLVMYPETPTYHLTAISILVVAANGISGSAAYLLQGRVHLKSALIFTVCSLVGVPFGVRMAEVASKNDFQVIFGLVILGIAAIIFWRTTKAKSTVSFDDEDDFKPGLKSYLIGSFMSVVIGFFSTFLGIGGGVIHVPLLAEALGYPVHLAAGTSSMILALTSVFAVIEHARLGHYQLMEPFVLFLVVGALIGAQFGASFSRHVSSLVILRLLASVLVLLGLRLVFSGILA